MESPGQTPQPPLTHKLGHSAKPREIREHLANLFSKFDYDPAEELLIAATKKKDDGSGEYALPLDERIEIARDFMKYRYPQLRAVDLTADVKGEIKFYVQSFGPAVTQDEEEEVPGQLPPPEKVAEPEKIPEEIQTLEVVEHKEPESVGNS